MATTIPAPVDYTDLDFDSLLARLKALLASVFPDLNLEDTAELASILLSAKAHIGDVLAYYLRRQGREARIATATQRASLVALCKLIGYRPAGATAAIATETFTLAAAAAADVTLPKGTRVRTEAASSPVRYQLLEDLVIPAGQTTVSATVEHSEFASDLFSSTRAASQRFVLSRTPYLDSSAVVTAGNGIYAEVQNFLSSTSTDRHFMTVVDQRDRCTVIFGDGKSGSIPVGTISVSYKTGGGRAGRVGANTLRQLEVSFSDANGNAVRISVTNAAASSGGDDRESSAMIKLLAPESLRVLERCVAREDYEIVARKVPGVARALHLTRNEDEAVQENEGFVWIVPTDGGTPSQALLDAVAAQYAPDGLFPCTNTYQVRTRAAVYKTFDVLAVVFLRKGYAAATVRAAILGRLQKFFAVMVDARDVGIEADGEVPNPKIDFGYYLQDEDGEPTGLLALSDVENEVRDTPGVLRLGAGAGDFTLNGVRSDGVIGVREFPKLGTVQLINGATGLAL